MKVLSFKELVKALKQNGYYLVRTSGSHYLYSNGLNSVAVPIHLKPIISTKIVKQCNLMR